MGFIEEQRVTRTLYYSLIYAAELLEKDQKLSERFISKVEGFIRDRFLVDEDAEKTKETVTNFLETLGWGNININYDPALGHGKLLLGRNKFIVREFAETRGTLLVLRAIFQGVCYHLFRAPVKAIVNVSLSSGSFYEVSLSRTLTAVAREEDELISAGDTEALVAIEQLTIEDIFSPIFGKNIPSKLLLESLWKVITESLVTNYPVTQDETIKEALKHESMDNLSFFINKLIELEDSDEIDNVAKLLGEYIVKILSPKIEGSIINKLQPILADRHADSYLIYYEKRRFCANRKFEVRCTFIHGLWVGMLTEIYGIPIRIKEVIHAGKRDNLCLVELAPVVKEGA